MCPEPSLSGGWGGQRLGSQPACDQVPPLPAPTGSPWVGLLSCLCLSFPDSKTRADNSTCSRCEDQSALSRPELISVRRGEKASLPSPALRRPAAARSARPGPREGPGASEAQQAPRAPLSTGSRSGGWKSGRVWAGSPPPRASARLTHSCLLLCLHIAPSECVLTSSPSRDSGPSELGPPS